MVFPKGPSPRFDHPPLRGGRRGVAHHGRCLSVVIPWCLKTVGFTLFLKCLDCRRFHPKTAIRRYLRSGYSSFSSMARARSIRFSDHDPGIFSDERRHRSLERRRSARRRSGRHSSASAHWEGPGLCRPLPHGCKSERIRARPLAEQADPEPGGPGARGLPARVPAAGPARRRLRCNPGRHPGGDRRAARSLAGSCHGPSKCPFTAPSLPLLPLSASSGFRGRS